jgi:hypothetical protein
MKCQKFGACHAEPIRSPSNRSERSEGAHGKLREASPYFGEMQMHRSFAVLCMTHGAKPFVLNVPMSLCVKLDWQPKAMRAQDDR